MVPTFLYSDTNLPIKIKKDRCVCMYVCIVKENKGNFCWYEVYIEAWIIIDLNAVESLVLTQDVGIMLQIKITAYFILFAFAFPTGDCTKVEKQAQQCLQKCNLPPRNSFTATEQSPRSRQTNHLSLTRMAVPVHANLTGLRTSLGMKCNDMAHKMGRATPCRILSYINCYTISSQHVPRATSLLWICFFICIHAH